MSIDAMKQALEALEDPIAFAKGHAAKAALRLAIEQAERVKRAEEAFAAASDEMKGELAEKREPVAKVVLTENAGLPCLQWLDLDRQFDFKGGEFLYTAPPQRQPDSCPYVHSTAEGTHHCALAQRQPLTPDAVFKIADQHPVEGFDPDIMAFARAIERAHGIT